MKEGLPTPSFEFEISLAFQLVIFSGLKPASFILCIQLVSTNKSLCYSENFFCSEQLFIAETSVQATLNSASNNLIQVVPAVIFQEQYPPIWVQ
jgi:hypothetical protein